MTVRPPSARSFACTLVVWVALAGAAPAAPSDTPPAPPARAGRHALLIGVTFYENLSKEKQLEGPANDVLLWRKMLLEKLQFLPEQVSILSEAEGKADPRRLPTKVNIAREFQRLAQVVKQGDQVVIALSGHGSQQPESKDAVEPELDGLDEIFLPRDVGAWDGGKGTVTNAIIDDEVGEWLKAIRAKKASIWIVFDSCHSGTMIRGASSEKMRDADPTRDLGIPREALERAGREARTRESQRPARSRGGEEPPPFKLAKEGNTVAIYAAQCKEVTPELPMPVGIENGQVYGLLTYTIHQVLNEALAKSAKPITYSELARRVQAQYVASGRTSPTPSIEGEDRDREVLGDKVWPGRSSMFLTTTDGVKLSAGSIHGLTRGAVLSVTPPPGQGDKLLGHVRITEIRAFDATVEPCDVDGKPTTLSFPEGAACKVVFIDLGDQRLKVAVDPLDENNKPLSSTLSRGLESALQKAASPGSIIQALSKPEHADWLIRSRGKQANAIVLVPVKGWSIGRDDREVPIVGPAPIGDRLGSWLTESLSQIGRAEALKRLAAGSASGQGDGETNIQIEPLLLKDDADLKGSKLTWPAPDLPVYDGEKLAMRISNPGRVAVDVTLLYIDNAFQIASLYPHNGEINRLQPGDIKVIRDMTVNSKTVGREYLVLIAVKAQGQPIDFSQLEQPSLELAKTNAGTRGSQVQNALETPLGKLLKRGMYGQGIARGVPTDAVDDYKMMLMPFSVRPEKRPLQK